MVEIEDEQEVTCPLCGNVFSWHFVIDYEPEDRYEGRD